LTGAAGPCDTEIMRQRAFLLLAAPAAVTLLLARTASADELNPGSGSAGQITAVNGGVAEMSLENIFVLGYDEYESIKNFRMTLLVGPSFRYFVAQNAVLGFNLSFLYKAQDGQVSSSDLGGVLQVNIGYLLPLSGGMFLKPLFGAGGFFGQRTSQVEIAGTSNRYASSVYGGIFRGGLEMVFYSSNRFNLFAGPEVYLSLGSSSTEVVAGTKVDGKFFLSVDGGLNVGLSYVF
jgi:hypothetical protein